MAYETICFLSPGNIQFIEADIVLGTIINDPGTLQPIMGHPPNNVSDLTLSSFLDQILQFNNQHPDATKGVKLDFKSIEVFTGSLNMLIRMWDKVSGSYSDKQNILTLFIPDGLLTNFVLYISPYR